MSNLDALRAAASKGLSIDPSDRPGRYFIRTTAGTFTVHGVDCASSELQKQIEEALYFWTGSMPADIPLLGTVRPGVWSRRRLRMPSIH